MLPPKAPPMPPPCITRPVPVLAPPHNLNLLPCEEKAPHCTALRIVRLSQKSSMAVVTCVVCYIGKYEVMCGPVGMVLLVCYCWHGIVGMVYGVWYCWHGIVGMVLSVWYCWHGIVGMVLLAWYCWHFI